MITTLHIKCPHCKQSSQVFLSTTVSVIILNCPACLSPIMYFRKKVVLLDSHLTARGHQPKVIDIAPCLDKVVEDQASALSVMKPLPKHSGDTGVAAATNPGIDHPTRSITEDDCTNLRIELELCGDSMHFIEMLYIAAGSPAELIVTLGSRQLDDLMVACPAVGPIRPWL